MLTLKQEKPHAERDQLSILLAMTLASATLFRFVELPTVAWGIRRIFGSPLNLSIGGDWLLTILMMGLVATGTYSLMQNHPLKNTQERPLATSLIPPTIGALLISFLLIRADSWPIWLGTLLLGGVLIGVLVHLSYRAFSPESPGYPSARTMLNIANYLMGFVLFSLVLQGQERALITGPAILLLSGLLALDLLSASGAPTLAVLLFASVTALLISEMAWVLGYWSITSWTAATLLTLGLYLWSGVGYQYLLGRLTRRVVLEFSTVALVMFILVLWIQP